MLCGLGDDRCYLNLVLFSVTLRTVTGVAGLVLADPDRGLQTRLAAHRQGVRCRAEDDTHFGRSHFAVN